MATKQSQRIGIWIIAIVMGLGTIGSFFVVILQNDNSKIDAATAKTQQEKYNKLAADYQAKVDAQSAELSKTYYPILSQFTGQVGKFTAGDVKSVTTNDLKVGDGEEIKTGTAYSAYYIGWNPDGKVFDQSIDGTKLKAPIPGGNLIAGWNEGVIGMKLGGVRVITMPADKAYGDKGSGDLIPPHTPLKFVVLAIPTPTTIPVPNFGNLGQ
ncbi:MAG: putative Peptidylprolyl isomerase [Candidatus Saccharibacteria bacterium]|nr:putative Peptidylprolyl isomerase [Candidatus Saccharibacteria bacterium]